MAAMIVLPLSAAPPVTTRAGTWTVAFLGIVAGVQMSDRGLQAILSPAIQRTFGVGDAVIGALHGIAGILVASALAMPLARLADRHSRRTILLCLIGLWTALTMLGALSPSFPVFFIGRAASGVTEFAMIPIVYSLIPDVVADRHRVLANLSFAALMATGASAGFYFGGDLLDAVGRLVIPGIEPWRVALLCLGTLGVPLLLTGLTVSDPPRGVAGKAETGPPASLLAFLAAHRRSLGLFVGAAGGLAVAVQATTPMVPLGIVRRFGANLTGAGHVLGLITLATSLGSLALAGALDRVLQPRLGRGSRPAIMGAGALIALPCLAGLALASDADRALLMVALFLAVTSTANALLPTMLQDLLAADVRARGFAVYSFVIACFCAVGAPLSGLISDMLRGDLLRAIAWAGAPALGVTILCVGFGFRRPAERTQSASA